MESSEIADKYLEAFSDPNQIKIPRMISFYNCCNESELLRQQASISLSFWQQGDENYVFQTGGGCIKFLMAPPIADSKALLLLLQLHNIAAWRWNGALIKKTLHRILTVIAWLEIKHSNLWSCSRLLPGFLSSTFSKLPPKARIWFPKLGKQNFLSVELPFWLLGWYQSDIFIDH